MHADWRGLKGRDCLLIAISKINVCRTNGSCPFLPKSVGDMEDPSKSDFLKITVMENEEENRERKVTTRFKPNEFKVLDTR